MANAVSDRLRNQAQKAVTISSFSKRGRVLAGYGGTLGGYTASLQKANSDKEDQIMQNKYSNGEVSVDDMIKYLQGTTTRSWLSNEDKTLLTQTIDTMKQKKTDTSFADKYSSGTITAKQYLAYKTQRLATINPGSALYDQLSTDVDQLKKAAGKEDLNNYFKSESARIANLGSESSQYAGYANLYKNMSDKANSLGLTNEANDYLINSGEYKNKSIQADQLQSVANVKKSKEDLVNKINLAINNYVSNKSTPQQFYDQLNQFQQSAITGNHTDLLNDLNTWNTNVREDAQYGKAFDRGGTRIKGPGVGTGGGATYDIYGNVVDSGTGGGSSSGGGGESIGLGGGNVTNIPTSKTSISGTSKINQPTTNQPVDNLINSLPKPGSQSPDIEDKQYADTTNALNESFQNGEITKDQYLTALALNLHSRKDDLDYRLNLLSKLNPNKSTFYDGSKQKNSVIIDKINKELSDPKTGINNIYNDVQNNKGNLSVIMEQALVNGFVPAGSKPTPLVVQNNPSMDQNYITDAQGFKHPISTETDKLGISSDQYSALKPDEQLNYQYSGGVFKRINQRYVEMTDKSGQKLRYDLNSDNSIAGATNLNTGTKYDDSTGSKPDNFYTPTVFNNKLQEQLKTNTANDILKVKNTPISKGGILPDITPSVTKKPILKPFENVFDANANMGNAIIGSVPKIGSAIVSAAPKVVNTVKNAFNQPVVPSIVKPQSDFQKQIMSTSPNIITPQMNKADIAQINTNATKLTTPAVFPKPSTNLTPYVQTANMGPQNLLPSSVKPTNNNNMLSNIVNKAKNFVTGLFKR